MIGPPRVAPNLFNLNGGWVAGSNGVRESKMAVANVFEHGAVKLVRPRFRYHLHLRAGRAARFRAEHPGAHRNSPTASCDIVRRV